MGSTNESTSQPYEDFHDYIFNSTNEIIEPEEDFYKKFDDNNYNTTNESTYISENKSQIKNKIFEITKEKRGKKEKKEKNDKKVGRKRKRDKSEDPKEVNSHTKYDYDNIIRKIQVHFHNFLISLSNEILSHFDFQKKILNIDYNNKKDIKKEKFEKLKSQEIGEILCQNISTKYKRQYIEDKEKNNKLYLEAIEYDNNIRKILSEPYINIFRNLYYKNKRDLNDYGLNITLSNKVQTYKDLLESLNKKGEDSKYIEKINIIAEECYLPKKIFDNN